MMANRLRGLVAVGTTAGFALAVLKLVPPALRWIDRRNAALGRRLQSATRIVEETMRSPAERNPEESIRVSVQKRVAKHLPLQAFAELIATLLLQHKWEQAVETARTGFDRVAGAGAIFQDVAAALDAFIQRSILAPALLEQAISRLGTQEYKQLRGALRLLHGRHYRDELRLYILAQTMFREAAADLDPREPAGLIELGTSWYCEAAHGRATECFERSERDGRIARPGSLLGQAVLAEDAVHWSVASDCYARAAGLLVHERDPALLLMRALPIQRGAALLALARALLEVGHDDTHALSACDDALRYGVAGADAYPEAEAYELRARLLARQRSTTAAAHAYYEAGRRFNWRGDREKAIEVLEQAIRLDHEFKPIAWQLADALRIRAVTAPDAARNAKDLERAARLVEGLDTLPVTPDHHWAVLTWSLVLEALADSATAATHDSRRWRAATAGEYGVLLAPQSGFAHAVLARLHRELGHRGMAFELSETALELSSVDPLALEERIIALANQGDHEAVLPLLAQLPDDAWRRSVAGYVHLSRYRQKLDAEDLKLASELLSSAHVERQDVWIKSSLAACRALTHDLEGARVLWREVASLATAPGEATNLGEAQVFLGMFKEAVRTTRAADPTPGAVFYLAIAELALGYVAEAEAAFARLQPLVSGGVARAMSRMLSSELLIVEPLVAESTKWREVLAHAAGLLAVRGQENQGPRAELDMASANTGTTGSDRADALLLARARSALSRGEFHQAASAYRALEGRNEHICRAGLNRVDAARSELAAQQLHAGQPREAAQTAMEGIAAAHDRVSRNRWRLRGTAISGGLEAPFADLSYDSDFDVTEWLVSPVQAWFLLEAFGNIPSLAKFAPAIELWLHERLGLTAPPLSQYLPPITLEVPEASAGSGSVSADWRFSAQTARNAVSQRFGVPVPAIHIRERAKLETSVLSIANAPPAHVYPLQFEGTSQENWLQATLQQRLTDVIGTRAFIELLELWARSEPERNIVHDTTELKNLTNLLRALLREQVPLVDRRAILRAYESNRRATLDVQLEQVRQAIRAHLQGNDASLGLSRIEASPELEASMRQAIPPDASAVQTLALAPAAAQAVLAQLETCMPDDGPAILIVRDAHLRASFQRVLSLTRPRASVMSAAELQWVPEPSLTVAALAPLPAHPVDTPLLVSEA